jgi:hypothetical protein
MCRTRFSVIHQQDKAGDTFHRLSRLQARPAKYISVKIFAVGRHLGKHHEEVRLHGITSFDYLQRVPIKANSRQIVSLD